MAKPRRSPGSKVRKAARAAAQEAIERANAALARAETNTTETVDPLQESRDQHGLQLTRMALWLADARLEAEINGQKVKRVSEANTANGTEGGRPQSEASIRLQRMFGVDVEGFIADNGRWPSIREAQTLHEATCLHHGLTPMSQSVVRRWLTKLREEGVS